MKYWDEPVTNTLQGRPLLAALTVCCAIGFLLCVADDFLA
jgi:preprotein translocase subunit Sec61beta